MATPRERFAEALQFLHSLQQKGVLGIHTDDMHSWNTGKYFLKTDLSGK